MKDRIISNNTAVSNLTKTTWLQKLARHLVLKQMRKLQHGRIHFIEENETLDFGNTENSLSASIIVKNPQFYTDIAFGGSIGAGEAYMDHYWDCDNLTKLVQIIVLNRDLLDGMERGFAWFSLVIKKALNYLNRNTKTGSRRNIQAHYDLGNDMFQLFLDETMMYSSAIFPEQNSTLHEASLHKLDIICKKLKLTAEDHVIEIGTGWGGFAIYAAQHYGCQVTSTTISKEQYQLAKERIDAANLNDKITLLLNDYRDLKGKYDKLVSIEMIEAVGHSYYDTFFKTCSHLLKDDGMMLIQSITIDDQYYESAKKSVDFIQRYIFPGGCLPSVSVINNTVARATNMRLFHMDDFGDHYAKTLSIWREQFFNKIKDVRKLNYPESFIRMWEYYLCYCEGGFRERSIGVVHMIFTKPLNRRAPIL